MTLKEFRDFTSGMPDDTEIMYHAYDKGCCLAPYMMVDVWIYKDGEGESVILNPGPDYDDRKPASLEDELNK